MDSDLPKRLSIRNFDLPMFFVKTAIDIDNHLLGREDVPIHYQNIFRVGKLLYEYSQERGIFEEEFVFNAMIDSISKNAKERNMKTTDEFFAYVESVSQDFGSFGNLSKERQRELRNLCCDLSNYSALIQNRDYSGRRFLVA